MDVEIDIRERSACTIPLLRCDLRDIFGVSQTDIIESLKKARVKGRIEMVKVSDEFTLMIDYAYNAMSLEAC